MKTFWAVFITAVVILGLAGGGYYYLNKQQTKEKNDLQAQINSLTEQLAADESTTATADETADWKTYTSQSDYLLTFQYPSNWQASSRYGTGEGTGISGLHIDFSQTGKIDKDNYYENDISIIMSPRKNGKVASLNEAYASMIEGTKDAKKSAISIGGIAGDKYTNMGGLAMDPEKYVVKNGDQFFFELINEKSHQSYVDATTQDIIDKILASVQFTK